MPHILITGGAGFVGRALLAELFEPAAPLVPGKIRVLDLRMPSEEEKKPGVEYMQGDIRNYEQVSRACEGIDLVIHSAAIVDWGTHSEDEVLAVNYGGTENIVKACKENGVRCLVYTSSLDAIFGGKPLSDVDERIPYPESHPNMYCRSKELSEKLVLSENLNGLATCVIRPSDIYGEHDPFHIGSLIGMAKGGFYIRIGDGKARCQHVYVRNIAHAHLLAGAALLNGNERVRGNAYLITDGPGTNFFKFFDRIVAGAGYRIWPKNLWLPRWLAYSMGATSEAVAFAVRPIRHFNPKLSRFAVVYTCTNFTFSSDKAKADFGYVPKYPEEMAVQRTIDFYKSNRVTE
jgi:nucleoside-diphosphate-sugar epimerase